MVHRRILAYQNPRRVQQHRRGKGWESLIPIVGSLAGPLLEKGVSWISSKFHKKEGSGMNHGIRKIASGRHRSRARRHHTKSRGGVRKRHRTRRGKGWSDILPIVGSIASMIALGKNKKGRRRNGRGVNAPINAIQPGPPP